MRILNRECWVLKRNKLNEMYISSMTIQELRLFNVYLSCINAKDERTKNVRFSLTEFEKILKVGRQSLEYYKDVVDRLLVKRIAIDEGIDEPYDAFVLFNRIKIGKVESNDDYYIEFYPSQEVSSILFDLQEFYFKYQLWNALNLKGKNHLRMYEILKQYESAGIRIVTLEDLRGWLGIEDLKYPEFKHFKQNVLIPCQKALAKHTDISFTFEPYKKKDRKVHSLKFVIIKNKDYKDPLIDLEVVTKEIVAAEAMDQDSIQVDVLAAAEQELKSYSNQGHVCMTKTEYEILVSEHGKAAIDACIADMEDYILSKGKFYENYPAAIRRWLRNDFNKKAVQEDKEEPLKKRNRFANFKGRERDYDEIERMEREYLVKSLESFV